MQAEEQERGGAVMRTTHDRYLRNNSSKSGTRWRVIENFG